MDPTEGKMTGTSSQEAVSTKLRRIAELARQSPKMVLTTLSHHIDMELLMEAWRLTRKDGAVGVDGVKAEEYEAELDKNLQTLLDRFKSGTYKAPPVRRVYIPKGDGSSTRPIGIPTLEDKILQRAVTMILEAVYEQDFLDCSYGFRPERSAHDALDALSSGTVAMRGGWVIDLDIQSFFDSLGHHHLRSFLDQRVRDGVIRRMIDKWLKAGVMDGGAVRYPNAGSPQGGVISPLLANVFLHHVLDTWFEEVVKTRLHGLAFLVRYADDVVIVCEKGGDASRLLTVLPKRFGRYGLKLHPDKTRQVAFKRPTFASTGRGEFFGMQPGTFDFLGFTHYWGRSRRRFWVVRKKTAKSRQRRTLKRISEWCRRNRHLSIPEQHRMLSQKLRGHYAYFGVTGNGRCLTSVHHKVARIWHYWLNRRAQRRDLSWPRFKRITVNFPLPRPVIVRSIYRSAAKP